MAGHRPLTAIGLMSGTSLDGIDAALITSDGESPGRPGPVAGISYDAAFRARLRRCLGRRADAPGVAGVARELTLLHAQLVDGLLADNRLAAADIDLIGFHGQTTLHRPQDRLTVQIGDPALLAAKTGIRVIGDFRTNDVAAGGQGAPLAPLYHAAVAAGLEKPVAVLNIGGVANISWIGEDDRILAFDTGPGNALIDDWARAAGAGPMDQGGRLAAAGRVDGECLSGLLDNPYFALRPPKSIDRDDFAAVMQAVAGLSPADGAATLTAFSAAAAAKSLAHLPAAPKRWLVGGGGRLNATLMAMLAGRLDVPVDPIEAVNLNGDALEAQAFAFLAIRSYYEMPISLPETTGAPRALCGGVLY